MTQTQNLIAGLAVFTAGLGLFIAGVIIKNDSLIATGTGMYGLALGWLGLKRPQDK